MWRCLFIFSADGQILLSGGLDRTIKLWDVATGCCMRTLMGDLYEGMNIRGNGIDECSKSDIESVRGFDLTLAGL
ncbi:hypothetical protein [Microcoleus sp. B9-D4]|uniref:hypothetical protein n=1 Tax=Microcoleus sp. B9-D4 TaxID=2818711 RepID=UPI002FD4A68C